MKIDELRSALKDGATTELPPAVFWESIRTLLDAMPRLLDLWESCERLRALRDTEFTGAQLDAELDDVVAVLERGLP